MQFNYLMAGSKCPRVQCDRPVLTDQSEAGIGWLDSAGNVKNNKVLSINGYCISATWCCCHFKRLAFSYIEANESSQPKWQQVFCSLFSVCVWIEKKTPQFFLFTFVVIEVYVLCGLHYIVHNRWSHRCVIIYLKLMLMLCFNTKTCTGDYYYYGFDLMGSYLQNFPH